MRKGVAIVANQNQRRSWIALGGVSRERFMWHFLRWKLGILINSASEWIFLQSDNNWKPGCRCVLCSEAVCSSVCPLTVFCGWVLVDSAALCPNSPCLSATYARAASVLTGHFPLTFTPDWAGYYWLFQILQILSHPNGFVTKSLINMRFDIKRTCCIDICFKVVWVILFTKVKDFN